MAASNLKLTIEQGATFQKRVVWTAGEPPAPVDLTGFTARMQIRAKTESATVLATLTTENGGITLGGTAGTVDLLISATETASYSWTSGVYDLELVSGAVVKRFLRGVVIVSKEVTRA